MELLRPDEVVSSLKVDLRLIMRWVESDQFPAPICLPDGELRWDRKRVRRWLASRPCAETMPAVLRNSQVARDVLRVLEEAGDWLIGAEVARRIDPEMDRDNGHFKEVIRHLREAGLIESSKQNGYRLTPRV